MFKVGERVLWNGKVPCEDSYQVKRLDTEVEPIERDAIVISYKPEASKMSVQIATIVDGLKMDNFNIPTQMVVYWVNKEDLRQIGRLNLQKQR